MMEYNEIFNDITPHEFSEEASLIECGMEIAMLCEFNWEIMMSEIGLDEYNIIHDALVGDAIKEDAILEAEKASAKIAEKFAAKMKKSASYMEGLFAKFNVEIRKLSNKHKFIASEDSKKKIAAGAAILEKEKATFNGYLITADNAGLGKIKKMYDKLTKLNADLVKQITPKNGKVDIDKMNKTIDDFKDNFKISKDDIFSAIGRIDDWKITKNTTIDAAKNFITIESHIKSAEHLFDYTKGIEAVIYANVKSTEKLDVAAKDSVAVFCKGYNLILASIARINSIYLMALKQDYNTNCKLLLKCYNAGSKALKNVKESVVNESAQAITYTTESISSIFAE